MRICFYPLHSYFEDKLQMNGSLWSGELFLKVFWPSILLSGLRLYHGPILIRKVLQISIFLIPVFLMSRNCCLVFPYPPCFILSTFELSLFEPTGLFSWPTTFSIELVFSQRLDFSWMNIWLLHLQLLNNHSKLSQK